MQEEDKEDKERSRKSKCHRWGLVCWRGESESYDIVCATTVGREQENRVMWRQLHAKE